MPAQVNHFRVIQVIPASRCRRYAADAFYGITLKGLEGVAVVPWVVELGPKGTQTLVAGGRATVAVLEGVWKGHEPRPWEVS